MLVSSRSDSNTVQYGEGRRARVAGKSASTSRDETRRIKAGTQARPESESESESVELSSTSRRLKRVAVRSGGRGGGGGAGAGGEAPYRDPIRNLGRCGRTALPQHQIERVRPTIRGSPAFPHVKREDCSHCDMEGNRASPAELFFTLTVSMAAWACEATNHGPDVAQRVERLSPRCFSRRGPHSLAGSRLGSWARRCPVSRASLSACSYRPLSRLGLRAVPVNFQLQVELHSTPT